VRTIIYTGKGGVGKTSLAAATGLASATRGHRTLVMSTDSAHSLGDSYGQPLGPDPVEIRPHLWGLEVDVLTEMERHWKVVYGYLVELLTSQGVGEITAKEVVVLPGMDLITALLLLESYERHQLYDVVVMDTAPTADTLRLLSFPDALEWYFTHILRVQRRLAKVARPTVGRMMKTPLPSDGFFTSLEDLYARFRRVREILTDPKRASVRLVLNPERMVISETQRAFTYLCLFGFPVEMLIVNRVLPSGVGQTDYYRRALEEQSRNLESIREAFGEVLRREVPRYPEEVVGVDRLERLAQDVFGTEDATRIFAVSHPVRFLSRGGRKLIRIELPFASQERIEVQMRRDTLYVRVGWYKRVLLLPYSYVGTRVSRASYQEGALQIEFLPTEGSEVSHGK
jgi:arsenite-transporting ATPase